MLNEGIDVALVQRVHDREEVVTAWEPAFGYGIRHEPHELRHALHVGPQISDGELVVIWDTNHFDITQRHE